MGTSLFLYLRILRILYSDGKHFYCSQFITSVLSLQGVPTSLGYVQKCLRAKRASFTKKNVFCSKKLLFEPFLWTATNENGFLSNFSPISDNLLNKLLHKTIGEKLLKTTFSLFAVHKKGSKSNFLEHNTIFRKIRNLRLKTSELQNITLSLFQTCWDTL